MATKRSNLGWWICGITIIVIPVLIYLVIGGNVVGEEFSPDDFSRRTFSYNIMPIFNICLRGIEYHDKTPVFEQTLLADGYLGKNIPNTESTKQWHLVSDSASDPESRDFDAKLLVRFLDLLDNDNESVWIKWNEDHPDLAIQFWPIVADMARNYLYVELTEVMVEATVLTDDRVTEFEKSMLGKANSAFLNQADQLKAEGDLEAALELYRKANKLLPSQRATDGSTQCLNGLTRSDDKHIPAEVEEE